MYWQLCKAYVQVKPHLFKTARYGNKLKICHPQNGVGGGLIKMVALQRVQSVVSGGECGVS